MIKVLEGLKYLATVIVALSVPGFGLVAFSFLAFCDHGPVLACMLRMAVAAGIALAQVLVLGSEQCRAFASIGAAIV